MITIALNIKECSDFEFLADKQKNYSYAFRKLYALSDSKNVGLNPEIQAKYDLKDIEFRSLQSGVATKLSQTTTNKSNQEQRTLDLVNEIKELKKNEKSNKNTRKIFNKKRKIKQIEDSLLRDITFGGKQTLRDLTRLHNKIPKIKNDKTLSDKDREKCLSENKTKIQELTEYWKTSRILPFYIIGEANTKGNRFFGFNLTEKEIFYNPYRGKKISIKYSCGKKQQIQLLKLQELIDSKDISVTMTVSTKQICLTFDNQIMSGYCINKKERRKEVAKINNELIDKNVKKALIKKVYRKHYDELRDKKQQGKLSKRYISVDLNPHYIGYCIADKWDDNIDKIIEKGVFDLSKLSEKLNLSSSHPVVIKQRNKREFEVNNAMKRLFEIANQNKVAYFVVEDLEKIGKSEKLESKEANRKIRNIWHRETTMWQIQKRCVESGIELIPINPVYTSFIGNLTYKCFDSTNSAIEICRRGMFKFTKGLFYPILTGTISDTMRKFAEQQNVQLKPRDVQIIKDCESWGKLFKVASHNGLRWRWGFETVEIPSKTFSMNSVKSKVKIVEYYD